MPKIYISQKGTSGVRTDLFLDGVTIGSIVKGEIKEIDLSAGEHSFRARMALFSSRTLKFTIFNKEIKSLTVFPSLMAKIYIPLVIFSLILLRVLISQSSKSHPYHYFYSLILLLAIFYFFGLKRKRYLIIKEEFKDY